MAGVLEYVKRHLQPKGYILCSAIISIGGLLNGFAPNYDTGSIGAVTTMPHFESTIGTLTPVLRGFTVALIMMTAALPGLFSGQLADHFGQLHVVMAGALTFTLGATLQGSSSKLAMFLVGRALAGIGEGLWLSNVSVYITEIAPSARRGMLVSMPQFMATLGICAGYFTCYGSIHIESSMSWRVPFIIQAVLGFILAMACLCLPMSPRWLLFNHRREEALEALKRLDIPLAEAKKDILRPAAPSPPRKVSAGDFLTIFKKEYRRRTLLGLFILGMIQLCGIDGVLYYAPTLFAQAGLPSGTATFLASGISSILMVVISIPAFLYADRWGRRASIITGGIALSTCMFVIGSLYASNSVHATTGAARWIVIVLIFVFALSYSATWAVVGKIYASEIQPAETRAVASSIAQGLNFLTNWLVAFTTPIFLSNSTSGAYFLFGGFSFVSVITLAISMPETRGYSLESIQEGFHGLVSGRTSRKILSIFKGPSLMRTANPDNDSPHPGIFTGSIGVELGSLRAQEC
ncbi:general substrate transporter [Xylogone sp. PMI_703]|nr:general substrate transporter [Xylogone sp. PMI_703]